MTSILIGRDEYERDLQLSLPKFLDGRLLIQGISGAGKSWTLRRLLEQSKPLIQQIIIDPEGEFARTAEDLGHMHVDARKLDADAFDKLAGIVRSHRISVVIDISEQQREFQMQALISFIRGLIQCPPELWKACFVAIDEVHLFAPWGVHDDAEVTTRRACIAAITDLMTRGRKRGLFTALATQRLQRLAPSVRSDAHNVLIGINTLDLDIKRAAETIGWDHRKASDRLPLLKPGEFVAVGPAFSFSPTIVKVGAVVTRHGGAAPVIEPPPANTSPAAGVALSDLEKETAERAAAPVEAIRIGSRRVIIPEGHLKLGRRVFTEEQVERFKAAWSGTEHTNRECADILGVPNGSASNYADRLGLPLCRPIAPRVLS